MTRWTAAGLLIELALVAAVCWLLGGGAGTSAAAATAAGASLTAALALPALAALLWGRRASNAGFMAAVVGVMLGKLAIVGAALLYVLGRTMLPRLELVLGLLAGWIASLAVEAAVLLKTRPRIPRQG